MNIDHAGQLKILRERVSKVAALTIEERSLGKWFMEEKPDLTALYGQINHFNPNFHRRNAAAWQKAMDGLLDPDQLVSMNALDSVHCPTLIVVGEADPIVPVHIMEEVQARIPGCELEVVPRAAHSAYFEQPYMFNERVLHFLAPMRKA